MSELNHMTAPALLQVENLRVSFKNEEKQYIETVKGISFSVPVNTTVALVGESGSGKSVTSLATMGLLPTESSQIASDSKILFEGKNLLDLPRREMRKKCGKDIAMIFQEPMSSCKSCNKFSTWACTETSSAETDSSQIRISGFKVRQRAIAIR